MCYNVRKGQSQARKACIGCACAKRGMPFDLASEASEENRGFTQLCRGKGRKGIAMRELTELIRADMRPALGVTEPGAIAFAVASAKSHVAGEVEKGPCSIEFRNCIKMHLHVEFQILPILEIYMRQHLAQWQQMLRKD